MLLSVTSAIVSCLVWTACATGSADRVDDAPPAGPTWIPAIEASMTLGPGAQVDSKDHKVVVRTPDHPDVSVELRPGSDSDPVTSRSMTSKKVKVYLGTPTRTWKCKVKGDMSRFKAWALQTCESLAPTEEPHVASVQCEGPTDDAARALETALAERADLLACFTTNLATRPRAHRGKVVITAHYADGQRQLPAVGYDEVPAADSSPACFEAALEAQPAGAGVVQQGSLNCSVYFARHR